MKHPIRGDHAIHRKTYEVVCKKIQRFYGVADAESFFLARKRVILSRCVNDEFGWSKYDSLQEWHEAKILEARFSA